MKVFLVEDDDAIGMGLTYSLEKEGYEVTHVRTVKDAKNTLKPNAFDICILDINLPDGSGYDICKEIKSMEDVPVIFLTAADAEVNVVMGLEIGADDYICKPFRVGELMARIKTVLRRSSRGKAARGTDNPGIMDNSENVERIGKITIYFNEARVCRVDETAGTEETIELTAMEYRLLLTFCNNRGQVLSRNQLLSDMWDVNGDFINDNTLTVYIKRLREKIEENPAKPQIIRTVRGLGYIMDKRAL
ncbi:MAG: response regulator transcription factor [Lachnospiraceae bacterium]|nr:response regulator transcription factor [Lachnospiraceae bacterium]